MKLKICAGLAIAAMTVSVSVPAYAQEEQIKQITQALSSAISQHVGDQVGAVTTSGGTGNAIWGEAFAAGERNITSYDGLLGYDSHPSKNYWGFALNVGGADHGGETSYGFTGYFADVFHQDDNSASFLLLEVNDTPSSHGINAIDGTADMNWIWRGSSTLTRLDVSYTGLGINGDGLSEFDSDVAAGLEVGFPRTATTPYVTAKVSDFLPEHGSSLWDGQAGLGIRGEVTDNLTLGAEAGATFPQYGSTGWYALIKFRSRFN